jgi:tRNA-Thr(GGU) m(6)t(6)A37 methyltransferase TsaA
MTTIYFYPIGIVHSPFKASEGTPIQPKAGKGYKAKIEVFQEYKEGLKDLDGFSHIIVIYQFHLSKDYKLLVKPYLEENYHGVFATRAPKRPNQIGLSVVRLLSVDDHIIHIENVDMLDNTPVIDIKPYVGEFDHDEEIKAGWLEKNLDKLPGKKADGRFESD